MASRAVAPRLMRRMVESDTTNIKIGHALGARNEMKTIADEFSGLARKQSISTPAIGSAVPPTSTHRNRSRWELGDTRQLERVWIALGVLGVLAALVSLLLLTP